MKEFFSKLWFLLDTKAKKGLPALFALFIFSSLLDVIGIGMVGLFLGLIASSDRLLHSTYFKILHLEQLSLTQIASYIGCVLILSFILKAIVGLRVQKKIMEYSFSLTFRMKKKLMYFYQHVPYAFHLSRNSSALINQYNQLDSFVSMLIIPLTTTVSNICIALFVLGFLLITQTLPTILILVVFIIIIVLNHKLLKNKAKYIGEIQAKFGGKMIKTMNHSFRGLLEIRVLGVERCFLDKLIKITHKFINAQLTSQLYLLIPRYIIEAVIASFIVGISILYLMMGKSPVDIVASMGMFAAAGIRMLPTMTQLTSGLNKIKIGYPIMNLIHDEFQLRNTLKNDLIKDDLNIGKKSFQYLTLSRASFYYESAKKESLSNITLNIKKGQSFGLIGKTGSGKSTLVNIMLGLLEPTSGQLLVDNKPIANKRAWMNNFAYIPQQIFLLDDTLKANIAFGIEEDEVDGQQLQKAIAMAQLNDVVDDLSNGIDTMLGENGVRLSGGQRQRVALARAFYHERDIIVMDEATSALDNETEKDVINSIRTLKGVKTLIVIAHRLTTVKHCDLICKLDQGRVVKVGTYEEVIGPLTVNM